MKWMHALPFVDKYKKNTFGAHRICSRLNLDSPMSH